MSMSATYSPEDNKLRLYPSSRLPKELYDRVKAAGFKWAPKQELFVAPTWSPEREDLLIELCGEIEDEDKSLVERAEERAERFEDYSEKRGREAESTLAAVESISSHIPLGQPILVGHHSERRARKDAERIQSGMRRAVNLWSTSKYWTDRAKGAIFNAKYKERPDVRARRIKKIESEKRKCEKNIAESNKWLKLWSKEGLTHEQARGIANYCGMYVACINGSHWTAWDVLRPEEERYGSCPVMTLQEVIDIAKKHYPAVIERNQRWVDHCDHRLAYERAMLAESGGTAADQTRPEVGGACRCWASPGYGKGWSFIKKVNKVSVTVEDNWGNSGGNNSKNFTRTIPFDKLAGLMSKNAVDQAILDKRVVLAGNGIGFFLDTGETREQSKDRIHQEAVAEAAAAKQAQAEKDAKFAAVKESAKQGVQTVVVDQFFPTPKPLIAKMIELAEIEPEHEVLEPSAGAGAIAEAAAEVAKFVQMVEINPRLCQLAANKFPHSKAISLEGDFLNLNGDLGKYDRVLMNPPFANGSDIKHIEKALQHLKPGGRLVAICANGPRQREKLMPQATAWIDLPAGSFKETGTNVNTAMIVIEA